MSPAKASSDLSKAKRPKGRTASKSVTDLSDRSILRIILDSAVVQPNSAVESVSWTEMVLDAEKLNGLLVRASPKGKAKGARSMAAFSKDFCSRYRLRVSSTNDLELSAAGQMIRIPRWLASQALGALGDNLLFTRRKARATGTESARELAYFGYGPLQDQSLAHPVSLLRAALDGQDRVYVDPILLDEEGQFIGRRWSVFDLLKADSFFEREVGGDAELARFQQHLREYPLDGNTVLRLRDFFEKSATIGLRDTSRWALGARHPWFDWSKARELIGDCFDSWGTENFLCPRVNIFTYDLSIPDSKLQEQLAQNQRVVEMFAKRLGKEISGTLREKLDDQLLERLSRAALDSHMDHPDFDLEAQGSQSGHTAIKFIAHAAMVLAANTARRSSSARRNTNLAANFREKGYESLWLSELDSGQMESFYNSLNVLLGDYSQGNGFVTANIDRVGYVHIPLVMYTFYQAPLAQAKKDEEILDSFSLDAMSEPKHAKNLRENPEVFGKLVVFFSLVLRHYLDTKHVPDLVPKRVLWDYMLLGLWGTSSPNLIVTLYKNKKTSKVRSQVKFIGIHQVKAYQPHEDRKHEAALAKFLASQMMGPVLEPSIIRALGTFLMAVEESRVGKNSRKIGSVAFAKQSLEVFREAARVGVKGTLVDMATMFELLLDNTVDAAQKGLARFDRAVARTTKKQVEEEETDSVQEIG